ncbi:MAG: fructose-1,6-bisphosphate aldolase/phosphatase [bacterium]|nr:fructose-1,6-bisphosphate aldolase/phosphatase [bacterium]
MAKVTVSVIKADIGGYVGHSSSHPDILKKAEESLKIAKDKGLLIDFHVMHCGDDLELIMTHEKGEDSESIHKLAWDTFKDCTELAKRMKLYGAGQDILSDAFSGNVKGMGPGVAEMEITERKSEPLIIFMGDKTSPGAWNLPLYKIFADPFNTAGLVIDPSLHDGFKFEVLDVFKQETVIFSAPEELYDMLVFIGAKEHYIIKRVWRKSDNEIAAVSSTQKLALVAGKYVGKDDPVLIVRSQSGFPAVGEVLEGFALPYLVAGWMRGSHHGPFMPVSFKEANPTRFDGPPRVIGAGFQLSDGKLIGPRDMFDDPSFERSRRMADEITDYMRRHGPFEPHRLPLADMEYTTLPEVKKKLQDRFKKEK